MSRRLDFHEIVSGRRTGIGAASARGLLRLAEAPYTFAVRYRNRRYDRDHTAIHRVGVPVVSVGNLTLGGTGKTPMVKWLARWFGARGMRVAIVSRGYGAAAGQQNDEALELAQALPGVVQVQNPDRVAGAEQAITEFGSQLILLDDGFQHRRLARDLDIVLLDATEPFGFGHVFPRGKLREPIEGLRRADAVCLTRTDLVDQSVRALVRARVAALAPQAAWCEAAHAPRGLINASGGTQSLAALDGARIAAFCGIGNPSAFRRALDGAGAQIIAWKQLPDHHRYTEVDQTDLAAAAEAAGAELLVCTHKDLVKLSSDQLCGRPLWALAIEMQILAGANELERAMQHVADSMAGTSRGENTDDATVLNRG
jgi:tetraacyldisaccharide 4'-kinase